MAKIIFRQKAVDDLTNIWDYTAQQWSESQADKYYETVKFVCKGIEQNPKIGKIYDGISKGLLGLRTGKHIIFYQIISDEEIEVIRILHERMDLKNRLSD